MSTSESTDPAAGDAVVSGNFTTSDQTPEFHEAMRKLRENNFNPANLPTAREEPLWTELRSAPYGLLMEELSALKNFRCPANVPPPRGVLPRIESGSVYKATDERIRAKFTISNFRGVNRYVMEAELMVDSGANTELKLAARKVRQLGLEIRHTQRVRSSTNDVCQVYVFSPVLVQATFTTGSVEETIQADLVVKCDKREYDELSNAQPEPLVFETPDCPIAGATLNNNDGTSQITVVQVSPTKHRPNDSPLQQAVIGIDGMKKLSLHLNGELQRLEIEEDEVLDEY